MGLAAQLPVVIFFLQSITIMIRRVSPVGRVERPIVGGETSARARSRKPKLGDDQRPL